MLMKSDLYWQVMPKPKSLQKPVSFLITYRENGVRELAFYKKYVISTHTQDVLYLEKLKKLILHHSAVSIFSNSDK